jgi:hypothetical protein
MRLLLCYDDPAMIYIRKLFKFLKQTVFSLAQSVVSMFRSALS